MSCYTAEDQNIAEMYFVLLQYARPFRFFPQFFLCRTIFILKYLGDECCLCDNLRNNVCPLCQAEKNTRHADSRGRSQQQGVSAGAHQCPVIVDKQAHVEKQDFLLHWDLEIIRLETVNNNSSSLGVYPVYNKQLSSLLIII
jgi:hypothetical protein